MQDIVYLIPAILIVVAFILAVFMVVLLAFRLVSLHSSVRHHVSLHSSARHHISKRKSAEVESTSNVNASIVVDRNDLHFDKESKKVWSNSFAALTRLIESCNYDISEHGYAKIAQFGNVKLRKRLYITLIDSVRMDSNEYGCSFVLDFERLLQKVVI